MVESPKSFYVDKNQTKNEAKPFFGFDLNLNPFAKVKNMIK
jgi:hypothetical protein